MIRALCTLPLLLIGAHLAAQEAPFEPSEELFASAAECRVFLGRLADEARGGDHEAVEGPYAIGDDDIRFHTVSIDGRGHRISEHRCAGAELSSRGWRHSMEEEEEFTVESVARNADWLKRGRD
jgi:hypothetical protein